MVSQSVSDVLNGWPHDHGPTNVGAMVKSTTYWHILTNKCITVSFFSIKFHSVPVGLKQDHANTKANTSFTSASTECQSNLGEIQPGPVSRGVKLGPQSSCHPALLSLCLLKSHGGNLHCMVQEGACAEQEACLRSWSTAKHRFILCLFDYFYVILLQMDI